MPNRDAVVPKMLYVTLGDTNPANWHNWVGPVKDSEGNDIPPIIGGVLGTSIASTPLLYWFDGDSNVESIKTASGAEISAKLDGDAQSGAQGAVIKAFNIWKSYTGIDFKPADSKEEANITFEYSDTTDQFEGEYSVRYGQTTDDTFGPTEVSGTAAKFCVPVYFNAEKINGTTNSFENADNYRYFRIILHEIGHTLGLNEAYPAKTNNNSSELDNSLYTVMAKGFADGIGVAGNPKDDPVNLMLPNETPMAWDILAVQYLYGVNPLTNAGDTIYGTNPTSSEYDWSDGKNHYLTIWDAGGDNDTIDLSCRTDGTAYINLSENENNGGEAWIRNADGKKSLYVGIAFDQSNLKDANGNDISQDTECIIENAVGTGKADVIVGNQVGNKLWGLGGKDNLLGLAGDDYLYGGDGDDIIKGGDDNDHLYGEADNDRLEGGKGDDVLDGGSGDDTYVYTIGDGNDTIIDADNDGNLQVNDANGNSVAINMLYSSTANVWNNVGNTVRLEHTGSWRLVFSDGGSIDLGTNFQSGNYGITLVTAADPPITTSTITGDLTPIPGNSSEYQYDAAGTELANVKTDALGNVLSDGTISPDRNDYLYDSTENDRIQAGGGDDIINATRGGNDILEGGSGNDLILDTGGDNLLFGDSYGTLSDLVNAGEIAESVNVKGDLLSAGSGDDQLYGSNRNDALFGGGGNDLIVGGGGDDVILADYHVTAATRDWSVSIDQNPYGANFTNLDYQEDTVGGNDLIVGGGGNDFIYAGGGNDNIDGGSGDDIIYGEAGNDTILGGLGDDVIQGDANWLDARLHGNDYIDGGEGNDKIAGLGGNDKLFGGDGNDELLGGDGNDELFGGDGNDELFGGDGNDYLEGGSGVDELYGGEGDNTLVGGTGDDIFYVDPSKETVEIYDDFTSGLENNQIKVIGNVNLTNVVIKEKDGRLTVTLQQSAGTGNMGEDSSGTGSVCPTATATTSGGYPISFSLGDSNFSVGRQYVGNTGGQISTGMALMMLGVAAPPDNGGVATTTQSSVPVQMSLSELVAISHDQNEVDFCRSGSTTGAMRLDPLLIDLDGDGIETTWINTTTYFDHNADGIAERTAWVGPDDGLLVMDRNGDGIINNGRELFGDSTLLKSGSVALSGFGALADLDNNRDGVINAEDSGFDQLRVWQDINGDAVSSADELHDLYSLGIKEIRLAAEDINLADGKGNAIISSSTVVHEDGTESAIADYNLQRNRTYTRSVTETSVSAEIAVLPDLTGFGTVVSLQQAMSSNTTLQSLVEQFVAATDSTTRNSLMEQLLFNWSGTDNVVPTSRGQFIDARKLAVVEACMGRPFVGLNGSNPNDQAALILNGMYQRMFEVNYAALMRQTHLSGLYSQVSWGWDDNAHQLTADLTQVATTIADLMAIDSTAGKDMLAEFARTWRTDNSTNTLAYLNFREQFITSDSELGWLIDSGGLTLAASNMGTNGAEAIDRRTNAALWDYVSTGNGNDVVYGGDAKTNFFNSDGDAILVGGGADDYLYGGAGADILDGGRGNDVLNGGTGDDTYIFRRGAGTDYIHEYWSGDSGDVIYVGDFITANEVTARRSGGDLVLTITDSDDRMVVTDWFTNEKARVEQVRFADGTTWEVADIKQKVLEATPYDDYIVGYETDDVLTGGGGNDSLYGGEGNDTLDGGSGNDLLDGGTGNDTYIWGRGSGSDVVVEQAATAGEINCIQLTEGVDENDLRLMIGGEDLYLSIKDTDDQLRIKGWFAAEPAGVDELRFADGTVWNRSAILSRMSVTSNTDDYLVGTPNSDLLAGGGGNDTIYGFDGDDILDGGADNDYLYGGQGNDTLIGGDGYDELYDSDGSNKLFGGAGDDWLDVQGGSNELDGGAGNDNLNISAGSNTILFRRGDGFDYVQTYLTSATIEGDTVVFGAGIRPDDLSVQINDSSISSGGGSGGGDVPMLVDSVPVDGASASSGSSSGFVQLAIGIGNDEGTLITGEATDNSSGGEVPMLVDGSYAGDYAGETLNLYNLSIKRFVFADGTELSLEEIIGMADSGVIGDQRGSWDDDFMLGSVADDTIFGYGGNDKIDARDNNDYVNAGDGDDAVAAGSGEDYVQGGYGNDVLAGGRGDDYLACGSGNDVYVFNRGDGNDFIDNYPGGTSGDTDTLSFGVDILPEDVLARIDGDNGQLVLSITGTDDSISIPWLDPYSSYAPYSYYQVSLVQFIAADGSARIFDLVAMIEAHKDDLLAADVNAAIPLFGDDAANFELIGTAEMAGGDYAVAYAQTGDLFATPTYLYGSWGNDTILGRAGDDTIEGGYGDDTLKGGAGDDTYVYNLWDGNDTIDDTSTASDPNTLLFGSGITPDDISLSHDQELGQLLLNITTTGETIRINHFLASDPYGPHAVEYFKFDDGTVMTWSQMIDKGFDIIGSEWDDTLQGTATTDRIYGLEGDDTINGSRGNDYLAGGDGDDRYLYNIGDGTDTIDDLSDSSEMNQLNFGEGIVLSDITQRLTYRDNTLIIRVGDGGDEIHLTNFNPDAADTGTRAIQNFTFSDGTVISYEDLVQNTFILQGDFGNDTIHGTNLLDRLYGYEGNDLLQGNAGNDTLTGGIGNDRLEGGAGNDTYVFHLGDGVDTITDSATLEEGNRILFGEGITAADIRTRIEGTMLVIEYGAFGDAIILENYSYSEIEGSHVVEQLEFSDGSSMRLSSLVDPGTGEDDLIIGTPFDDVIDAKAGNDKVYGLEGNDTLKGGSGNDYLEGGAGADTLTGGTDNDILLGGSGFDTYVFSLGDGSDTVFDAAENGIGNILSFGEGISQSDITITVDNADLLISYGALGDQVRINNYNPTGERSDLPISALQLADGTTINLQELLNQAPLVGSESIDQTVAEDVAFSFKLPDNAFIDPEGLPMTYRVSGPDNTPLPSWISFNPITRTFSGTPGNNEVGTHELVMTAYDDLGASSSRSFFITVQNTNDAPTVGVAIGVLDAIEDQGFSFVVPANAFNDIDAGDSLTYAATMADGAALPDWLSLDAVTGTFSGTPTNDAVGTLQFKVIATDTAGASANQIFSVSVANTNDAPVVFTEIGGKRAIEDEPFSFQIPADTFKDVDAGDQLTYSATLSDGSALPAWLTFDASTGTFSGTPDNSNVGTLQVAVIATDLAGTSATATFALETVNTNDAPVVGDLIAGQTATEDQPFSFTLPTTAFKDVDAGDQLSYSATLANGDPLPAWLQFDAASKIFSGIPANDNVGNLDLRVTATDMAGAQVSSNFNISIANINDAPELVIPLVDQSAIEDQSFSYQIPFDTFKDVDAGDQLTYSATLADGSALPSWLTFNAGTGILTGTPGNDQVGSISLNITATDNSGATANSLFSLNIANVNDAPELLTPLVDQNAKQGESFSYQIASDTFRDIDKGDILSYSASVSGGSSLPAWLTFDAATGTFFGTPDSAGVGSITLNLTATDQAGASITDSFNLTVTGGNSAPVATPDAAVLTEDRCPTFVSGNVLANDHDPDTGDTLTVVNPGFRQGDYGYLGIGADGQYGYILNNQSCDVQSLGRSTQVIDHFDYTVTDGKQAVASSLDITINGTNDAPIIAHRLADQSVKNNKAFSFTMPTDSFVDIDKGDSLSYTATTADGKALPSWLKFDAATGTFSGTAPKNAGYLDIRVTATDKVTATGSTEGSLSVSDVFELNFGKSSKGTSDCYDEDNNYKHDNNFDWIKKAGSDDHGNDHDNPRFDNHDDHHENRQRDMSADRPIHYLDSKQLDAYLNEFDDDKSNDSSWCDNDIAKRWLTISRALAYDLAELGDEQGRNHRLGADTCSFGRDIAGTIGSTHAFGMDTTLASGNCGTDLKGFKGLNEGIKRM